MIKPKVDQNVKNSRIDFSQFYLNEYRARPLVFNQFSYTDESMFLSKGYKLNFRSLDGTRLDANNYYEQETTIFSVNIYGVLTSNSFDIFQISNNFNQNEFHNLMISRGILSYINSNVAGRLYFVQDNSRNHGFEENVGFTFRDYLESHEFVL